jgi:hypothetical protein
MKSSLLVLITAVTALQPAMSQDAGREGEGSLQWLDHRCVVQRG